MPDQTQDDSYLEIDAYEAYDAGLATEASEPNAGNAVVGYDPARDQRRNADDSAT